MKRIHISTSVSCQGIDITTQVQDVVAQGGKASGIATVFVPHTTAGVMINENADPDVIHDILEQLETMVPARQPFYRHSEGNSAAHVKAVMTGSSVMVPFEDGRLSLGRWQGIFLCEFDGPRVREVLIATNR